MSKSFQHNIPDYITKALGAGGVLSDNDTIKIQEILNASEAFAYPESKVSNNWVKLKAEIQGLPAAEKRKVTIVPMFIRWSVAAMLVVAVSLGIWKFNSGNSKSEFVYSSDKDLKVLNLEDGSKITLNSFSKLITNDLSADSREVVLIGEAFFEVSHNETPFIVKTDRGNINVTGTKFSVKNRLNMPLQVALAEGQVIFKSDKKTIILKPGEIITAKDKNTIFRSAASIATYSWIESKLVFENEVLSTIITTLENQYNAKFDYDASLKNERLTLTFDHLTAIQAAELLSRTLNSKVNIQ